MYKGFSVQKFSDVQELDYENTRECINEIFDFLDSTETRGKICALFGLRRTGKTTLLQQAAKEIPVSEQDKGYFIVCDETGCNFRDIMLFLENAVKEGAKYFFIDEITYAKDFLGNAAYLANGLSQLNGAKIIVSGTNSLGLSLISKDAMYDRIHFVNTSYISVSEYCLLAGSVSVDDYIKAACVLGSSYASFGDTQDYIKTSIVNNIIDSLEKSEGLRAYPPVLTETYKKEQIANEIQRHINRYSQTALISSIKKDFESTPIHSAFHISAEHPEKYSSLSLMPNIEKMDKRVAVLLGTDKLSGIEDNDIEKIYGFLEDIGLFKSIPVYASFKKGIKANPLEFIVHPGMYYANIVHAIQELKNDENWFEGSAEDKATFIDLAYNSALGKITENVVIFDIYTCLNACNDCFPLSDYKNYDNPWYVSKFSAEINKRNVESDVLILNKNTEQVWLFEIKHSSVSVKEQSKHLENPDMIKYIEENFGKVQNTAVLYNGSNIKGDIPRLSIKDFLQHMYDHKDDPGYTPDMTIGALLEEKLLSPKERIYIIKESEKDSKSNHKNKEIDEKPFNTDISDNFD